MARDELRPPTPSCLLVLPGGALERLREVTLEPEKHGVRFAVWRPGLATDGFDVVVHRAAYDVARGAADADAAARLEALRRCGPRLLDPLERAACFADRGEICRALARLEGDALQPPYVEVRAAGADVRAAARAAGLRYPLLCKPLVACAAAGSHSLSVVLREEGLAQLRPPLLLQEHVDHGGHVIKAYVLGGETHVRTKPSLPDLAAAVAAAGAPDVVHFDSQEAVPEPAAFQTRAEAGIGGGSGRPVPPRNEAAGAAGALELEAHRTEAAALVERVAAHMGVRLLGVDLVVRRDGRCLIVDANYFPQSPASFPRFCEALAQLVAERSREGVAGTS